jgi:hypothetical protein
VKAEDIPQSVIDSVRAASTGKPGLPDEMSDGVIVTMLVAAWDFIYGSGYTDGFSEMEESEINAELLEKHGWAPHYSMWFDGADSVEAEALMDAALDAADAAKPEHVTIGAIGVLSQGVRRVAPPTE